MELPIEMIDLIAHLSDPVTQVAFSFTCRALVHHRRVKKMEFWTLCCEDDGCQLPEWARDLNCFIGGSISTEGLNHMPSVLGVSINHPQFLKIFAREALPCMEHEVVHVGPSPYQQRSTVHLNNSIYHDRLSLPTGHYFTLPFDGCAFIEAVMVGSNGSSAFLKFVIQKQDRSYRILRFNRREIHCTDDRAAYTPMAIDLGVTILLKHQSVRVNGIFTSLTVS